MLFLSALVVYFVVLITLALWNLKKIVYCFEQSNEEPNAESVQFTVQKVFCLLIFLLAMKAYSSFAYVERCPWALENSKGSYFFA